MRIAFFSAQAYEKDVFNELNNDHDIEYFDISLNESTVELAKEFDGVCCFICDDLNANVIDKLAQGKTKLIVLRSAGFNHVNLKAAKANNLRIYRVPEYSPHAIAEHTAGLILSLNRKIHKAYYSSLARDFSIHGLKGFDLYNKTVGIIGMGKIGLAFANIMRGFGCEILAYDPIQQEAGLDIGVKYVTLNELFENSKIISLHCPLTKESKHLIDKKAIAKMQQGVMIINTSRGGVIDSKALIAALKNKHIGALGLDVYEEENNLFFKDHSDDIIQDDIISRLLTFPNVLITSHQAFFTDEAVHNIAQTTLDNISNFENNSACNEVVL